MAYYPTKPYGNLQAPVPAQQYVARSGSTVGGSFEIGRGTWTEQWDFNFSDLQQAIEYVLGFATVDGGSLNRRLPAHSAQFPNMFATSISAIEALAPTGMGEFQNAAYKQWRLTIQFELLPYFVQSNAQVAAQAGAGFPAESLRYVVWNRQPASEFARTPYNAYKYPPNTGSPNQNKLLPGQNGQAFLLTKYRITGTWVQVPEEWISDDGGYTFAALDRAVGTVNQGEFLGYPAGTMLFESYLPTPRVMPTSAAAVGQLDPAFIPRCYDVEMKWLYFDPQPFLVPTGKTPENAPRGHNLVFNPEPGAGSTGAYVSGDNITTVAGSGYWQRALLKNKNADVNGNWLYFESDHDKIFKAV